MGTEAGVPTALFTWGTGRFGQLALGDTQVALRPRLVECLLLARVFPKQVACGAYHCAVVTGDGEVGRPCAARGRAALRKRPPAYILYTLAVLHVGCRAVWLLRPAQVACCAGERACVRADAGHSPSPYGIARCHTLTHTPIGRRPVRHTADPDRVEGMDGYAVGPVTQGAAGTHVVCPLVASSPLAERCRSRLRELVHRAGDQPV